MLHAEIYSHGHKDKGYYRTESHTKSIPILPTKKLSISSILFLYFK